jgi:hypothetical protein
MAYSKCRVCGAKNRRTVKIISGLCQITKIKNVVRNDLAVVTTRDISGCLNRFSLWLWQTHNAIYKARISYPEVGFYIDWQPDILVAFDQWLEEGAK